GRGAARPRPMALLRGGAGQGAYLLHRERAGVRALQGRARLPVIGPSTRLVALLGHPVAHSLSPRMQNAAFAARGLDWAYVALDVPPERLAEAVTGLAALGFSGANVTAPHKTAVAELVGAGLPSVNTLVLRDGRLQGFSTDAAILAGLEAERPVIVGDGGAAAAFREALPHARVVSR